MPKPSPVEGAEVAAKGATLPLLVLILSMLASAVLLAASSSIDKGRCLKDHQAVVMVPMMIGKSTIMTPRMQTICDQWEYPEGRPT